MDNQVKSAPTRQGQSASKLLTISDVTSIQNEIQTISILTKIEGKVKLFAVQNKERKGYIFNKSDMFDSLPVDEVNISIPLNIDTEYVSRPDRWLELPHQGRKGLTTQIRGIEASEGLIFAHPGLDNARHPKAVSGFHPVDYLAALGHTVTLRRDENVKAKMLPTCEFLLYGHFILAESMMIVDGEFKDDFKQLMRADKNSVVRFAMQRRLAAVTTVSKGNYQMETDYVDLPWVLNLDGYQYAVRVCFMDTCAVHGVAGYKDFCEASGIKLEYKDVFSNAEKGQMDKMYFNRPDDFDNYALGDLYCYDALAANADNFKAIYKALGIETLVESPKLTIGSTVKNLFSAKLQNELELDDKTFKTFSDKFLKTVSASHLKHRSLETAGLLAKVEGGRCRNNRPTTVNLSGILVDLDISGCYGEGQRNQQYPVGTPEIQSWDSKSAINEYWSLRRFLKEYGVGDKSGQWKQSKGELVSGCWFARVTTFEKLSISQDYLASWFIDGKADIDLLAKYILNSQSDSEQVDNEFNVEDGSLKILNHEVKNGVISHDFLDWLFFVASTRQRKELLDNLFIISSMVYPASKRVDNIEQFFKVQADWTGKNTQTRFGKTDGECHTWFSFNIGQLIINDLLANRKLYVKKTPLNTLFKLCVNTLYGDMVSKFFDEANVCVGNNITARARALAWYMEKGLNGFQTVTDGCAFDLNNVVKGFKGRGTASELVNMYRTDKRNSNVVMGSIAPTGETIEVEWLEIEGKKYPNLSYGQTYLSPALACQLDNRKEFLNVPAMDWINQLAMQHLQSLFPEVDVLYGESTSLKAFKNVDGSAGYTEKARKGQFEFEAKQYYTQGTFQGSANYMLQNPNPSDVNIKMRSYENKKQHDAVTDGKVADRYSDGNSPAVDFLKALATNHRAVNRQMPFVKEAILKPSDYKNRLEYYDTVAGIVPGDSFMKVGMLRELSISQFTFKTLEQFRSWEKSIVRSKDKNGQSLESYFLNEDGSLNYQTMVETVDKMIADDILDPFDFLTKATKVKRGQSHPGNKDYNDLRDLFSKPNP
jgi:hypothetical protein